VNTPTGVAVFPGDAPTPIEWAKRKTNVKRFTIMEKGGHFAALEAPELWVKEVDTFFKNDAAK
jgi:pimeloyl-ACP methyl ester carboxylesterase